VHQSNTNSPFGLTPRDFSMALAGNCSHSRFLFQRDIFDFKLNV